MPLKINLYHEVQRTRKHAQYDPLRLSMFGLIAIVVAMAGYYAYALGSKSSVASRKAEKQAEYDKLVPRARAAKREEEGLAQQIAVADNLTKRIEERFYWAPVMERVIAAVPAAVQLTHVTGEIAADATRKCSLVIEGLAAGDTPRKVAEDLRVGLTEKLGAKYVNVSVTFRSLDDGTEKVQVEGRKLDTANFAIAVTFLPKAPVEPTPPPARSRRVAKNADAQP